MWFAARGPFNALKHWTASADDSQPREPSSFRRSCIGFKATLTIHSSDGQRRYLRILTQKFYPKTEREEISRDLRPVSQIPGQFSGPQNDNP